MIFIQLVFSIPSPKLRDRKHTTCWIKIVSHHKAWETVTITYVVIEISQNEGHLVADAVTIGLTSVMATKAVALVK
jgi:hypothetical protein